MEASGITLNIEVCDCGAHDGGGLWPGLVFFGKEAT